MKFDLPPQKSSSSSQKVVSILLFGIIVVGFMAVCILGMYIVADLYRGNKTTMTGVSGTPSELSGIANTLPPNQTHPVVPVVTATLLLQSGSPTSTFVQPSTIDIPGLLAQMSLEEKVGQMIMTGVSGRALTDQDRQLVAGNHFGTVVYFGANTHSPGQVLKLSQDLQKAAANSGHGIPLLIAIDHEGGEIVRFDSGVTVFPSEMALGATNSPELAYQVAAASAQELRAAGINMDLGPVLDINDTPGNPVIGLRSFGGFADRVTNMGASYIAGLQDSGLIAVGKHYPGHGSTISDSHVTLPVLNKSLEQLKQNELMPFVGALQAQVGGIMAGHIADPQVDPQGRPASLSPVFIQDVLRSGMGFDSVIMTDAMSMGAVTDRYDPQRAAVMAVQAGVDLLAYTDGADAQQAYTAIIQAVYSGGIPTQRIDASARRILVLKARFGLFTNPIPTGADIPYETHLALAQQAAQSAITLSGHGFHPLVPGEKVLVVSPDALSRGRLTGDNLSLLGELLRNRGLQVDEWIYPVGNPAQMATVREQVMGAISSFSAVVVVTWDAKLRMLEMGEVGQSVLVSSVLGSGVPTTVVAASSPYDLELIPATQPGFAMFGGLDIQVEGVVNVLVGAVQAMGVMPVNIVH